MKPTDDMKPSKKGLPSSPRSRRKPPPRPATWDQQKALDLAEKGVRPSDIAAMVGVSDNTVRRYLQRVAPELEALRTFKDRLGDSLALTLAKCSDLEDKLLDALNDETVIASMSTTEKERLLGKVTIAKGVTYDKLRLHEGKSTTNSSHRILLEQVHKDLRLPPLSSGPVPSGEELH
jgi:predicted transcriptional regulator